MEDSKSIGIYCEIIYHTLRYFALLKHLYHLRISVESPILFLCRRFRPEQFRGGPEKWSFGDLDVRQTRQVQHGLLCGARNRIRIAFDADAWVSWSPIITRRGTIDRLKRPLKTTFVPSIVHVYAAGLCYRSRRFRPDFLQITYWNIGVLYTHVARMRCTFMRDGRNFFLLNSTRVWPLLRAINFLVPGTIVGTLNGGLYVCRYEKDA